MAKKRKDLSSHYKENNEGGYGNPPVKHQFQGKPGPGRPRGSKSFAHAMKALLRSTVPMRIDGVEREVSVVEAFALRTRKEMLSGGSRSLEFGREMIEKYGPEDKNETLSNDYSTFSSLEKRLLAAQLARGIPGLKPTSTFNDLIGCYEVYRRDDGWLGFRKIAAIGGRRSDQG